MAEPRKHRSLEARLRDDRLIEGALRRAVQDALLQHKRAGNPVPVSRDGRVVWVPPEEIDQLIEENAVRGQRRLPRDGWRRRKPL